MRQSKEKNIFLICNYQQDIIHTDVNMESANTYVRLEMTVDRIEILIEESRISVGKSR